MNPTDKLDRELVVGDFVVFYNDIYEVTALGKVNKFGKGPVRLLLVIRSESTRPVKKYSNDCCKLDAMDVVVWKLKRT